VSELTVERHDGVATMTLRAPERRNALTPDLARSIIAACEDVDADATVGAVVVTGEGGYFCAGGDRDTLTAAGRDPAGEEAYRAIGTIYEAFARVGRLQPPTIAAVTGGAVGAGLNLMFATDLRVVDADAKLVSGFLPLGIHPGGGHGLLLAAQAGREIAAAMALFGEPMSGAQAAARGLAWTAVPGDRVLETAQRLAVTAAHDPELSRLTARSFRATVGPPMVSWSTAIDVERPAQMWSMRRRAGTSNTPSTSADSRTPTPRSQG
jgi:enoyl-CoA hydratase